MSRPANVPRANAVAVGARKAEFDDLAFADPPNGGVFERPEFIQAMAPRIWMRTVETRTMPLGNLTSMTEDERRTLGAWIAQGARLDSTATGSP